MLTCRGWLPWLLSLFSSSSIHQLSSRFWRFLTVTTFLVDPPRTSFRWCWFPWGLTAWSMGGKQTQDSTTGSSFENLFCHEVCVLIIENEWAVCEWNSHAWTHLMIWMVWPSEASNIICLWGAWTLYNLFKCNFLNNMVLRSRWIAVGCSCQCSKWMMHIMCL